MQNKIGLRLSVCQCVSVSVCVHSHGRISWSIFTKISTDIRTHKSKNEFVEDQYRTTHSPILPPSFTRKPILGQEVLKIIDREFVTSAKKNSRILTNFPKLKNS